MKVLLITMWKPRIGGIVTHVENLLKRSDHRFLILTYREKGSKRQSDVFRVPTINIPLLRGASFAVFAFIRALFLDFHVIHAHYSIPQGFAGVLIKKVRHKPMVLTVHGSDLTVLGGNPAIRPFLKWVFNNSDLVIAVSKHMKGLITASDVPQEKVRVVYNGVEPGQRDLGTEKRVIFIGALVRQKGVDVLIEAFKDIKHAHSDVKLVIAGDGPDRMDLENQAANLGVPDIEFKGFVKDIQPLFTSNSVLVLPSREEGFGITLLEAMVRGVPVVWEKMVLETQDVYEELAGKIT